MSKNKARYLVLVPGGFQYAVKEAVLRQITDAETSLLLEGSEVVAPELLVEEVQSKNANDKIERRRKCMEDSCSHTVGSIEIDKQHVFVGYDSKQRTISCVAGLLPGTLWMQINTASPEIANIPCLGPLTALVSHYKEGLDFAPDDSLDRIVEQITGCIRSDGAAYQQRLRDAMLLWQYHMAKHWEIDYRRDEIRYRFSYVRHDSKKYKVGRQEVLGCVDLCNTILPLSVKGEKTWKVDLTDYHLEVVLLQRRTSFAIVLALRPYQLYDGVVSFANGGIPSDITPPYIHTHDVVRLRPTTASLLLELAQCQPGDVVLDPCAGIGTIPIVSGVTALGGDVILGTSTHLHQVATDYLATAKHRPNMLAWDASLLPIRTNSIDVVVSDLPFGRQCSSSAQLDRLLPLVVAELSRVVRKDSGRMVLLCGSYIPIFEALKKDAAWTLPCKAVIPVSISGNSAWVIVVNRSSYPVERNAKHRDLTKKLTRKRDMVARFRSIGPSGKKRKEQA